MTTEPGPAPSSDDADGPVTIGCIALTVEVQSDSGRPIMDGAMCFHVHGGFTTGWRPLDANGERTEIIHTADETVCWARARR